MNFETYINWILENPKNFMFNLSTVDYTTYFIFYRSPYTGLERCVLNFYVKDNEIIDYITELKLGNINNINFNKFKSFCLQSKYF